MIDYGDVVVSKADEEKVYGHVVYSTFGYSVMMYKVDIDEKGNFAGIMRGQTLGCSYHELTAQWEKVEPQPIIPEGFVMDTRGGLLNPKYPNFESKDEL